MDKKMLLKIIPGIVVFCIILTNVFGFGGEFNPNIVPSGNKIEEIKTPINRIWGSLSLILKMCAVVGILLTGIRYMFTSADGKADMKKTLPLLITGIVIVFASSYVIEFIVDVVEEVTN